LAGRDGWPAGTSRRMDVLRQLLKDLGLPLKHGLSPRTVLRTLAAAQNGQFATEQARLLELKPSQIHALHKRGEIEWVRQRVWRFVSSPEPVDDAVTAFLACWPHAVISHASAANFHGLTRVDAPDQPEVTVRKGTRCRVAGVVIHTSRSLEAADILSVGPLRYTSLARTVCDLATPDDPWETLSILDDAVAGGASRKWIHNRAVALGNRRPGIGLIERATRAGASDEFRSWLERAGAHVITMAGLPPPMWNVEVRDDRGRIGIVDALWLPERVICELKGLRFHTAPTQVHRDDKRLNRLFDAGYGVRVIGWRELVDDAPGAVATIGRALQAAGTTVDLARIPQDLRVPTRPFL
jgi:hypothetical protein